MTFHFCCCCCHPILKKKKTPKKPILKIACKACKPVFLSNQKSHPHALFCLYYQKARILKFIGRYRERRRENTYNGNLTTCTLSECLEVVKQLSRTWLFLMDGQKGQCCNGFHKWIKTFLSLWFMEHVHA